MNQSPQKPTFQVVVDCHGEAVDERNLYYLLNCVMAIVGAKRTDKHFWVTRTDLFHDYLSRYRGTKDLADVIVGQRFHAASFDLYLRNNEPTAPIPVGRLVNVKIPERESMNREWTTFWRRA